MWANSAQFIIRTFIVVRRVCQNRVTNVPTAVFPQNRRRSFFRRPDFVSEIESSTFLGFNDKINLCDLRISAAEFKNFPLEIARYAAHVRLIIHECLGIL